MRLFASLSQLLLCAVFLTLSQPANSQNVPVAGFGTSLKFDGTDDFARIDNYNGPTGDFTIEFWVKPIDLVSGWRGFFGHQPGNIDTRGPSMWQNGDKWHCDLHQVGGGRFEVNIPNVFQTAGEWVHLAWVKNGTTMYYYRNGKQIFTRTAPANGNYVTTNKLFFGYVDNHFNANFDEVRIWNVARTRDQINDYRFRNLDNTTGLLHYYPLDEGSGTTINDAIGGKNGILSGGPTFESAASAPPITTPEDTPVSSYAKGSDVNGDALTFAFTSNGTKGTATFTDAATGAYTYTPNANENGADSFQYTVTDTDGTSTPAATVNVAITAVNDAPTGQDDHYHIAEDGVLTLAGTSVLDNDVDLDGDHLTATLVTDVSNGTLVLDQNGTFTYTPNVNYNGTDAFTYKPNDGTASATAASTVSIRVDPVNDAPVTTPDTYTTSEDTPLSVALFTGGVLQNDRDPDGNPITALNYTNPSHGTLTTGPTGDFTYTPDLNFNGTDSFTYRASDGSASSAPETVTITVRAVNDDPVVHDDSYSVPEDGVLKVPASLGLLANDSDPDADRLQVDQANQNFTPELARHGKVTALNPDGSFIYVPDANFNGADKFQYVLTDGTSHIGYGTVRIQVTAVNDAPVANDDLYTVAEDGILDVSPQAAQGNLLSNDSDADNNTLFISLISGPTSGALHLNGKHGDFQYRPDANFNGTDQFVYKISDGKLFSGNATVTIKVHAENDSPVSQPDAYSVAQGGLLTVKKAKGLLANDTDADANTLYVQLTSGPAHGTLQMRLDGSFTYQHNGLDPVTDSFTYRSFDGAPVPGTPPSESGLGNEVTVTLNINRVNHPPLGAYDSYIAKQDKPLTVFASGGVLANDLDIDGDQMIALIASYPAHGALGLSSDGSFSYQPQQGYTGTDSFTYRPMDGKEQGNVTTVTLDVQAVNTAPLLGADSYFAVATQPLTVGATNGVLSNDIDPEGHPLAVTKIGSAPANGSLQLNADGSFTYVPGAGFAASDTFTYFATDGTDVAGPVQVTINEAPAQNQAPLANDDLYTVAEDGLLDISYTAGQGNLLSNDFDAENNPLTITLVTGPTSGALHLNGQHGDFQYRPNANFNGTDQFVYRVSDGALFSNDATVTIQVHAENDSPVSQPDAYSVAQGGVLSVTKASGLLANDSDADANTLYVQLTSSPTHGTLQMQLDGSFTYRHNGLNPVTDSFRYRSYDGAPVPGTPPSESGLGNEVTVTLNVNRVNHPPVGVIDRYTVKQDKPLSVATSGGVLSNDVDIDGDQLLALIVSYPSRGALGWNSDGSFSYQPQSSYTGSDSFTYRPMDGKEQGGVTTVKLDIQTVNSPPLLGADSYFAVATQTLTVGATSGVLSNDIDPEGHPLTVTRVGTAPADGSVQLNADGSFVYIPGAGFSSSDTFSYYATDGIDEAGPATVTINEAPAQNQVPVTSPNTYTVQVNSTLQVSVAEGVLNNDSDPDGQLLTASLVSISDGSVNLATDGSFTFYAPASPGVVIMVYQADDGICSLSGDCPSEQVTITVTAAPPAEPIPTAPTRYLVLIALAMTLLSLRNKGNRSQR